MDLAEVHKLSDNGTIGEMDLEKMDILEDLEGASDGKVLGGFSQLVGNEDILGLETVPEKFLGQGIDEEGQGHDHGESHDPAGSLQKEIFGKEQRVFKLC